MRKFVKYSMAGLVALGGYAAAVPAFLAADAAPTATANAPATGDVAQWVSEKVQSVQPTAAERRFDEIGWLTDLRQAIALGKQHNRPVFLFTHDGRMARGRC